MKDGDKMTSEQLKNEFEKEKKIVKEQNPDSKRFVQTLTYGGKVMYTAENIPRPKMVDDSARPEDICHFCNSHYYDYDKKDMVVLMMQCLYCKKKYHGLCLDMDNEDV